MTKSSLSFIKIYIVFNQVKVLESTARVSCLADVQVKYNRRNFLFSKKQKKSIAYLLPTS